MTAQYRTARPEELPLFHDWAAAEGWNPGLEDMQAFHAAEAQGFFVAQVQDRPVAAISVVNHSDSFAFLGFYLCLPVFRGQGIGFGLWQHALAHAAGRTVGLDGVADQEANYARSGFERDGASVRYAGQLAAQEDPQVRPLQPQDFDAIARLDVQATGVARPDFLRAWTTDTATRRSFVLEGGTGLVTIRRCREGVKIGPLLAPSLPLAWRLLRAGLSAFADRPVFIDIPEAQTELAQMLGQHGFAPTFQTARMYRGPAPQGSAQQFAIASMELG
jgi:GNAT superfamily N-acetyltransferase